MNNSQEIIIDDGFRKVGTTETKDYVIHSLCTQGSCTLIYNNEELTIRENDLFITREQQLIDNIRPSDDFRVEAVFISDEFITQATPDTTFGIRSVLILTLNPLLSLNQAEVSISLRDIHNIIDRSRDNSHDYQHEVLAMACLQYFLDIFNFENRIYGKTHIPVQSSHIITDFIELLRKGNYIQHRDVPYYADKLFVTPKHLSNICRKATGHPATYWISHFVKIDIKSKLRYQRLSIVEISEMLNFSSPAHFTRYVQTKFGVTPSAIREIKKKEPENNILQIIR